MKLTLLHWAAIAILLIALLFGFSIFGIVLFIAGLYLFLVGGVPKKPWRGKG